MHRSWLRSRSKALFRNRACIWRDKKFTSHPVFSPSTIADGCILRIHETTDCHPVLLHVICTLLSKKTTSILLNIICILTLKRLDMVCFFSLQLQMHTISLDETSWQVWLGLTTLSKHPVYANTILHVDCELDISTFDRTLYSMYYRLKKIWIHLTILHVACPSAQQKVHFCSMNQQIDLGK